jgi:hypothetical protein
MRDVNAPRGARKVRPRLEFLECRNLPSTYVVDRLTDAGAGSGLAGDLRYCLMQAADGDAVTFAVTGTINLTGGELAITRSLEVEGPGAGHLAVSGNHDSRVFDIGGGVTVTIAGLTIANGRAGYYSGDFGGGIYNAGTLTVSNSTITGNSAFLAGGGIYNCGTLTVVGSTLTGNECNPSESGIGWGDGPPPTLGGGIDNDAAGTATVSNSTISGNSADPGHGGGISNEGALELRNSTVAHNTAFAGFFDWDTSPRGGGIANRGTLAVTSCTVAYNRVEAYSLYYLDGCGGISTIDPHAVLYLRNTIVAGNDALDHASGYSRPSDLQGILSSSGYNLIGNSAGVTAFDPTDLLNVDARLGPLQDGGGPTRTMALLPGSPALNAGDPAELGTADQRGVARTGGVNIGAYQASASSFVLAAPATATAGVPFDLTVRAVDAFGQAAVGYAGTAHLSSTDGQAALPADYTFTLADGGTHAFHGVALRTAGSQAVSATDAGTDSLTGSATVAVTPAAADHLRLSGPASASAGTPFDLVVTVQDAYGNAVTGYAGTVTFATDDPDGVVPADYTFTAADAGTHTFAGGVTLFADGSTVTARDTAVDGLAGSVAVPLV